MNATASQTGICNLAMVKLGISVFMASIDDDTPEAVVCKQVWDEVLNEVLELGEWACARKRISLAREETAPAWGYSYQFQLPNDCIKVLETSLSVSYPWVRESDMILTDATDDTLEILYIYYIADPTYFSPLLVDAIATRLAYMIFPALCRDAKPAKRQELDKEFGALLRLSRGEDARWRQNPDTHSPLVTEV